MLVRMPSHAGPRAAQARTGFSRTESAGAANLRSACAAHALAKLSPYVLSAAACAARLSTTMCGNCSGNSRAAVNCPCSMRCCVCPSALSALPPARGVVLVCVQAEYYCVCESAGLSESRRAETHACVRVCRFSARAMKRNSAHEPCAKNTNPGGGALSEKHECVQHPTRTPPPPAGGGADSGVLCTAVA